MNEYEIMLLLDPELAEERANEVIQRLRDSVDASKGSWDGHEPWGRRRLTYEIDHKSEAVYHLLLFTTTPETLAEITRVLKITDGVIRHLAVRRVKDGHLKPPSAPPAPVPGPAQAAATRAAAAPTAAAPTAAAPAAAAPAAAAPAAAAPSAEAPSPAAGDSDESSE